MRICSWNVNGLRAAVRKGYFDFIEAINPDIILLQEIRVTPDQLTEDIRCPHGWFVYWNAAEKKGYSGTAIWSKYPIESTVTGLDGTDPEGRLIHAVTHGLHIIDVYLPSGTSGDERQQQKELWMASFFPWSKTFSKMNEPVVIGGDLNIAHTEKDIFYAKSNKKNSGFLPHERAWFGELLDSGWHDFMREQFGDIDGPYSWWSNRGKARELDRGWRIDYLLGNDACFKRFKSAKTHREGGMTVSDHAPITVDLA